MLHVKFCAHLFEHSLLQRLLAFYLREWLQKGRTENTEMGIRMHSLFFQDAVVARLDISLCTVISRIPRARYHIHRIVISFCR